MFFGGFRHAPELDIALDYTSDLRAVWVQPLFVNEACEFLSYYHIAVSQTKVLMFGPDFHGAMAIFMTAFPVSQSGRSHETARVRHLCLALQLTNACLSGKNAASNETVMVVLTLGLYERYQGEYRRGLMHLDGLVRMVELRGGIHEFGTSRLDLARKILR